MLRKKYLFLLFILGFFLWLPNSHAQYEGKKILYVDSYHPGYEWSDGVLQGIKSVLNKTDVILHTTYMDTKRHSREEFKKIAALKVNSIIAQFQPDVVITSDDNAAKYLIVPYYLAADLPFVFCGVNWDASAYGFPEKNITGMLEISMVDQIITLLKKYAAGDRIGFLAEDSFTDRKNIRYHSKLLGINYHKVYFINHFADWKQKYKKLQDEVDILLISSFGNIMDWDEQAARDFVIKHTKIPTGTEFSWRAPLAVLSITKIPEEQGKWAAQTALKILEGASPANIPIASNQGGRLLINMKLVNYLNLNIDIEILKIAEIIK